MNNKLNEEFDIENEIKDVIENVGNISNITDIDNVIFNNIKKANNILDKIIQEIDNEGMSPRLAEVGSMLINSINSSYNSITNKDLSEKTLMLKVEMLKLKEKEIEMKRSVGASNFNQNNIIINANRESVLKMLKGEEDKNIIDVEDINDED